MKFLFCMGLTVAACGLHGAQIATEVANGGAPIAFAREGTLVGAVVFGHPGTYDGLPFVQWSPKDATPLALDGGVRVAVEADSYCATDLGGGGPYQTELFTTGGGTQTLIFSGLDAKKIYAFQVAHFENRKADGLRYAAKQFFLAGDGWRTYQDLEFGPGKNGGAARNYALLTVTVSGTDRLSYNMPRTSRGPSMNGFSVRVVDRQPPSAARPGPKTPPTAALTMPADVEKILFIKRFTYNSNHYYTEFINSAWMPGGNLCVLDVKTRQVREVVPELSSGVFERYDLSFDARRVVFAWKKGAQDGYRIYEVNVDGTGLRQLTFPPADEAELERNYRTGTGYHHGTDDLCPCYLPDGGIAFVSTRCQYSILCDGSDTFTTTVLYRMDGDGKRLTKLSNSSVSETGPSMLPDGRLLYTRWEYVDKGAVSVKGLWAMRPDGTASAEVFGNDIDLPPTLNFGRVIPGVPQGYVVMGVPHYPNNNVGTVIRLDLTKSIRTREPMTWMTPYVDIRTESGFHFENSEGVWEKDPEGTGPLFADAYPLSASLFLVAHKPGGTVWTAAKGYGLYLLDERGAVCEFYRDPAISCWRPMPLRPRPVPPVTASSVNAELASRGEAACMVADVYHGLEGVPRGAVKYLRVLEQVPRPWAARCKDLMADEYDQQHIVISKDTHLALKVQHGIVPVEADGSANFVVPADANIFLQALDADCLAVQTERTFVDYRPGEIRACIGCHETPESAMRQGGLKRGSEKEQPLAFRRTPSRPGPQPGEKDGHRILHYPSDVQPIFDRLCVSCHGNAEKLAGGLDLRGTPTKKFCASYESLVPERRKGSQNRDPGLLGVVIGENHPKTGNVEYLPAGSLGARTSVLAAMLSRGKIALADAAQQARAERLAKKHADVAAKIAPDEFLRLTNWIDTNCQYYGSYWGRRDLKFRDSADFRRVPTFGEARDTRAPAWVVEMK
jgi:hypothetical protein